MRSRKTERAQAIIVAGFLIAVGMVAIVALLNSAVLSVSEQPETNEESVDTVTSYRSTMVTESREALSDVNSIAARKGLNNKEVNRTYVDYVEQINERMQKVYSGQGLVGISDIDVNSSFDDAWRVRKNRTIPPTSQTRIPLDVVFVIDTSGSMDEDTDDGVRKIDAAQTATKDFVRDMKPLDRASIVAFDTDSGYDRNGIYKPLTLTDSNSSKEELYETIDDLDASGGTYLGGGIREAVDELKENGNSSHQKYIIALTDGDNTQGWVHFQNKYVDDGDWRHEWGYSDHSGGVDDLEISDTLYGSGTEPDDDNLDERDITQAERADKINSTVYTIGFGQASLKEEHLQDIAGVTGNRTKNYYYAEDAGKLQQRFRQIYDNISDPTTIATNATKNYRMSMNITDFPGQGNVTLSVNDNSSQLPNRWKMVVTNLSSSHPSPNHVVVYGNSETDSDVEVLKKYDYSLLGNTPLNIDIMQNQINGFGRNMSTGIFNNDNVSHDITLEYAASIANLTYDFRVDENATVDNTTFCPNKPCAGKNRQVVGSIHNANFTISYQNEDINYSEPISMEVNPVEEEAKDGTSGTGATAESANTLEFSTPVYDYEAYYPLDNFEGSGWLEEHAFDASDNNNTAGLEPDSPSIDNFSSSKAGAEDSIKGGVTEDHSYRFRDGQYVRDADGWNNIPINGSWTISMWFKPEVSDKGVLFGASKDNGDSDEDRVFQIATNTSTPGGSFGNDNTDSLVWSYEDRNGEISTVNTKFGNIEDVNGTGWYHVAVVGGWNDNRTQMFVNGTPVNGTDVQMGGKPMQANAGDGNGNRLGAIHIGGTTENGVYVDTGEIEHIDSGFNGTIDDVRVYHADLSNVTEIETTTTSGGGGGGGGGGGPPGGGTQQEYLEDFEAGGSVPNDWDIDLREREDLFGDNQETGGMTNAPTASGTDGWSIYTAGAVIESKEVDLSGTDSAELSYLLMDDSCGPGCNEFEDPEGDDDLIVEYTSDGIGWNELNTLDPDVHPTGSGPEPRTGIQIPDDGLDEGFKVRYRNPNADSYSYCTDLFFGSCIPFFGSTIVDVGQDHWVIDNFKITSSGSGGGGGGGGGGGSPGDSVSNVVGTPGYVEQIYNDTKRGYITTAWQNFTDDSGIVSDPVDAGGLRLEDVDAELNGGEISVWVQSDTNNDNDYEEQSNEIELDGSGSHLVKGLSDPSYRFRLRIKVDHPDTTDAPKFYDADLVGS